MYNQKIGVGERKTTFIDTFISHKFELYDSQPNEDPLQNELLMSWTIPNHGIIGYKNYEFPNVPVESVERQVQQTLKNEWRRHEVVKRTFSPLAFDKGRLPDDLYASLGAYWYNNRDAPHKVHEECKFTVFLSLRFFCITYLNKTLTPLSTENHRGAS